MTAFYLIIGFIIGLLAGLILLYLYLNRKNTAELNHLKSSHDAELNQLRSSIQETQTAKIQLEEQSKAVTTQLENQMGQFAELSKQYEARSSEMNEWKSRFQVAEEKLRSQKEELGKLQEEFTKNFQNIANKILEEKTQKFTTQNKEQLEAVLSPFNDRIKDFSTKVEETYVKGTQERSALIQQIKTLSELNGQMQQEARNLTNALKHDNKTQGNWGEIILERILENSGLIKGEEYETQYSTENQEGERLRPDVIVRLPEGKHIIIDSKVSLTAYEAYMSSETEEEQTAYLKQHVDSVKRHIRQLSEKNYQHAKGVNTPDFVLLFIPVEPSFGLAVRADNGLFQFAWDKKIVLVSPSTLLATLRTISSVWKQERQNKNALEIARQAGSLYDKLVGFISDMEAIESALNRTQKSYDAAMNKLVNGKGNAVRTAEKIRSLGAKTQKSLPNEYLDNNLSLDE